MRILLAVALALALAGCVSPGGAGPTAGPVPAAFPTTAGFHPVSLTVDGQPAHGVLAVPDTPPQSLLVVAKGIFTTLDDLRPLMASFRDQGHLVLAMDFRGPHGDWKATTGTADTVAATLAVQRQVHVERTVLYGISLGGQVGALALAAAPSGTYTDLVVGAAYGDFVHAWDEQLDLREAIEREAGGPPAAAPLAYVELSPLGHVASLAAAGVGRVVLVHAAADTVVPARESEALYEALSTAGVPTTYYAVVGGHDTLVCAPFVLVCPTILPAGPANHESTWTGVMLTVVADRLAGPTDDGASHRVLVDELTGTELASP